MSIYSQKWKKHIKAFDFICTITCFLAIMGGVALFEMRDAQPNKKTYSIINIYIGMLCYVIFV